MNIDIVEKIGTIDKTRKNINKDYKKDPSNFDKACHVAFASAKKCKKDMVLILGNSYMNKVFHILACDEDYKKVTVRSCKNLVVGVVNAEGDVFKAIVN